jgi:hypothetical protein
VRRQQRGHPKVQNASVSSSSDSRTTRREPKRSLRWPPTVTPAAAAAPHRLTVRPMRSANDSVCAR